MSHEITCCIIKPDSISKKKAGAILSRLEEAGFDIIKAQQFKLTPSFVETFYQEHREKEFFPSLVEFMSSGNVLVLALKHEGACLKLRTLMGATDPKKAENLSLRAEFGESVERNAIHGSDSLKSAQRELALFFPGDRFCEL